MGRRSKYKRKDVRVSREWVDTKVQPRITDRDEEILRFLNSYRIATSSQIADLFWNGRSKKQDLCNRRLRILYDLYCIDRYFPLVESGSSLQHLVLDKAGSYVLGLEKFNKRDELPLTYRHMILTTEFIIQAKLGGFGYGEIEHKLSGYSVDIYYPKYKIAVEIDTGTETHKTLKEKTKNYNRMGNLNWVLFVTLSNIKRGDSFIDNLNNPYIKHKARCQFKDLTKLLRSIKNSYI